MDCSENIGISRSCLSDPFIVRNLVRDYNTALPDGAWRSPASALAWGARGPGFNSRRPDTKDSAFSGVFLI